MYGPKSLVGYTTGAPIRSIPSRRVRDDKNELLRLESYHFGSFPPLAFYSLSCLLPLDSAIALTSDELIQQSASVAQLMSCPSD